MCTLAEPKHSPEASRATARAHPSCTASREHRRVLGALLSRFLRTYGTLGLEHGLQQAVDAAIDNNWRRDPVDRRNRGALPHDVSNPDSRVEP